MKAFRGNSMALGISHAPLTPQDLSLQEDFDFDLLGVGELSTTNKLTCN